MGIYEDAVQKIANDTAKWFGRVPGPGAAPAAAPTASPTASTSMGAKPVAFYNRPVKIPSWMKALGGPVTQIAGAGLAGGALLKAGEEKAMEQAGSNILAPGFQREVGDDVGAYNKRMGAKFAAPASPRLIGEEMLGLGAGPLRPEPVVAAAPAPIDIQPDIYFQPGTGAAVNNETGETVYRRSTPAPMGAVPARWQAPGAAGAVGGIMGDMISYGAQVGQEKRAARAAREQDAINLKLQELRQNAALKGPGAAKELFALDMASKALAGGASPRDVMATLMGRAPSTESYSIDPSYTTDPNAPRVRLDRRTGETRQVIPRPANIEEHIAADMKSKKLTRAQVLDAYRLKGIDITGL